ASDPARRGPRKRRWHTRPKPAATSPDARRGSTCRYRKRRAATRQRHRGECRSRARWACSYRAAAGRQTNGEAGAEHLGLSFRCGREPVLRRDPATMCLHGLPRDRKTKTGVVAEALPLRAIGIEAVEDAVDLLHCNTGAVVIHRDDYMVAGPLGGDPDLAVRRRERAGVVDQVVEHLAEPGVMTNDAI